MSRFLTEKYKSLKPYTPGEQPKDRQFIKLNTNESPYPPSDKAIELAAAEAKRLLLYPDPEMRELTELMAKTLGVGRKQCIMSNGSDEVLNFAFMAWCDKSSPAVFPDITYGFYKVFADLGGIPYVEIPLRSDFTIDVEDYVKASGTVFIANPNAPTGIALTLEQIERILISNTDRIVVIDEAYVDFGTESAVGLISRYDNLLVTGTFSKSRSMAGARLGYAVGSEALIDDLNRIKYSTNPYNVNRMTAAAGIGALVDKEYFEKNCESIIQIRTWCKEELEKLGFECTDSVANFLFVRSDRITGRELYSALREAGILVRHFDSDRICDYNRITVGNREQMQALVDAIKAMPEFSNL